MIGVLGLGLGIGFPLSDERASEACLVSGAAKRTKPGLWFNGLGPCQCGAQG